jgi:pfkB family carbohydrate kinase
VLATSGEGAARRQRLLAWAGPLPERLALDGEIVHLAPVARELPERWSGDWRLLCLTPQGIVREWSPVGAPEPSLGAELALPPSGTAVRSELRGGRACADPQRLRRLGGLCDAIVISELERGACAELIAAARARGAVVAVTAGPQPVTLHAGGRTQRLAVTPLRPRGGAADVGAGDVFAAALFAELAGGSEPRAAVEFAAAAAALRMRSAQADAIADRAAVERHMHDVASSQRPRR